MGQLVETNSHLQLNPDEQILINILCLHSLSQDVTPEMFLAVLSGDAERLSALGYPGGRVINRYSIVFQCPLF